MSDTPDQPIPSNQDPIEPSPTSAAPGGLEPSPGLTPPPGMAAPQVPAAPQPQGPMDPTTEFAAPQYGQQAPNAQQYIPQDPNAPQYGQQDPNAQQFAPQDPNAPQYGQQDPNAQQFAPQDPNAQQFAPQDPNAPQYGQAPAGGPKKGLSTGAIIGIVGGAVALIILLVVGFFVLGPSFSAGDKKSDSSNSESSGKPVKQAKTPEAAVENFLNAVADGDANTARKLAGGASSDTMLTEKALKATLKTAPITNITVEADETSGDDFETIVTTTFDVGDTTINRDFRVWKAGSKWDLSDALISVSLSNFAGLDPTLNGIEVSTSKTIKVFPGAYDLALGLDRFEVDGGGEGLVLGGRDDSSVFYDLKPVLTAEAVEEYRTLVRASLTECLASTTFTTECGLEVSSTLRNGETVIDGTITRSIDAEGDANLNRLAPQVSYSSPTVVSTYDYISVTTTAEVDNAGVRESGTLTGGGMLLSPTVDFAEKTPKVTWE